MKYERELAGPFRTVGKVSEDPSITPDAPVWWHGDEEAYESSMAALKTPRRRGRRR